MKSKKTTVAAALGSLAVLFGLLQPGLDGDPNTAINLNAAFDEVILLLSLFGIGFWARDDDVSSEGHKAAKNVKPSTR